jgi:hypothetical protein
VAIRGWVAIAVAVVAATGLALAPRAGASEPPLLPPDLVTLALQPSEIVVQPDLGGALLRFSNEVANRGLGPLEVFPSVSSTNCDGDGDPENDRDAAQRLFADADADGAYVAGVDSVGLERPIGCMRYHPAHDHWHVLDFARYELRREPTGKQVALVRKVGFCIVDTRLAFAGPLAAALAAYPYGPPGSRGCDREATQGLSVGWADIYLFGVPGQEIEIGGLPRGRYCLISRVDPHDVLEETNEENNVRRVRLELRPRLLSARKLPGACKI